MFFGQTGGKNIAQVGDHIYLTSIDEKVEEKFSLAVGYSKNAYVPYSLWTPTTTNFRHDGDMNIYVADSREVNMKDEKIIDNNFYNPLIKDAKVPIDLTFILPVFPSSKFQVAGYRDVYNIDNWTAGGIWGSNAQWFELNTHLEGLYTMKHVKRIIDAGINLYKRFGNTIPILDRTGKHVSYPTMTLYSVKDGTKYDSYHIAPQYVRMYPSCVNLHSDDGRLYITYVACVEIYVRHEWGGRYNKEYFYDDSYFWPNYNENESYFTNSSLFQKINDNQVNRVLSYQVPMIMAFDANAGDLDYIGSSAISRSSTLWDSVGTDPVNPNYKTIPWVANNEDGMTGDGSISKPASINCLSTSLVDNANNKLISAYVYESPDNQPNHDYQGHCKTNRIYVKTFDLPSLCDVYDSHTSIEINPGLASINKIDSTMWNGKYIISVSGSTDANPGNNLVSVIYEKTGGGSLSKWKQIDGASHLSLQGISGGKMT